LSHPLEELLRDCNGPCTYSNFQEITKILAQAVKFQPPFDKSILITEEDYYNDHGIDHFERVENNFHEIISKSHLTLNSCELLLALLSIWFHDIGLFLGRKDGEDPIEGRKEHYRRVRDVINRLEEQGNIANMDNAQKELLISICEGHSRKVDQLTINETVEWNGETVRPQMLSSILRVADALDIDKRRAPESIFDLFGESIPVRSREHWEKHFMISGIIINPNYSSVDVSVFLNKFEIKTLINQYLILNWVGKEVLNEIESVEQIFDKNQIPIHNIRFLDGSTGKKIGIDSNPSGLTINTSENCLSEKKLEEFTKILTENSGDVEITLKVTLNDQSVLVINLPSDFSIQHNAVVYSKLQDIFSPPEMDTLIIPKRGGVMKK